MDKWDALASVIVEGAEPKEKAVAQVVAGAVADFGRTIEQISADIDRIATALEGMAK